MDEDKILLSYHQFRGDEERVLYALDDVLIQLNVDMLTPGLLSWLAVRPVGPLELTGEGAMLEGEGVCLVVEVVNELELGAVEHARPPSIKLSTPRWLDVILEARLMHHFIHEN